MGKPIINYWSEDTTKAIFTYKKCRSQKRRNAIYETRIYPAFQKLAECIYYKSKVVYMDDSPQNNIHDVITKLTLAIDKIQPGQEKTAFAYFTVVAKRCVWDTANWNYKHQQRHAEIEHAINIPSGRELAPEFQQKLYQYWKRYSHLYFKTPEELAVARAVVELIKESGVDGQGKRFISFYLRDITGVRLGIIQGTLKKVNETNKKLLLNWNQTGEMKICGKQKKIEN